METVFNASSFSWIRNQGKADRSALCLDEMPRALKVRRNDGEVRTFARKEMKMGEDKKTILNAVYAYGGFFITVYNQ